MGPSPSGGRGCKRINTESLISAGNHSTSITRIFQNHPMTVDYGARSVEAGHSGNGWNKQLHIERLSHVCVLGGDGDPRTPS